MRVRFNKVQLDDGNSTGGGSAGESWGQVSTASPSPESVDITPEDVAGTGVRRRNTTTEASAAAAVDIQSGHGESFAMETFPSERAATVAGGKSRHWSLCRSTVALKSCFWANTV